LRRGLRGGALLPINILAIHPPNDKIKSMKNSILILILALGIIVLGYLFINKKDQDNLTTEEDEFSFNEEENNLQTPPVITTPTQNNQGSSTTTTPPTTPTNPPTTAPSNGGGTTSAGGQTTIMVPLGMESSNGADFGPFACLAYLKFVPQQVPETQAVLNATYEWLFSNPGNVGQYYNTIASQTNLNFSSVEIVNGVAKVYLTGFVMGNHCADATFAAQIEQAALQYPSVNDIEVYVNGQLFDWCDISDADPEESGCDTTPRLWNSQRIFEIE